MSYIEKAEKLELPVVVLNGIVAFPSTGISFEITDKRSESAAAAASGDGTPVLLVAASEPFEDGVELKPSKLFKVGTAARIKQLLKTPDGQTRVVCEGISRASVTSYRTKDGILYADAICKSIKLADNGGIRGEAYIRELIDLLSVTVKFIPSLGGDILTAAKRIKNPGQLADFVGTNVFVKFEDKQTVLETFEPFARIETVIILLERETELLDCEAGIHKQVQQRLSKNQKDYYLREQIKVIEEELGDGTQSESAEYKNKIKELGLSEDIEKKLLKENDRFAKAPFGSPEANVLSNYLDICLELPWNKATKDRVDVKAARRILDADHDGLEKVKERILEYLAIKQLNPDAKSQILCLVGPPGVGKTSIASSIARSMKRKYVRVSLGGIRDEADMRGHRKTYIGAMPGRIISAIGQAGVKNPLILLDEIDKLTRDAHGDPTSALLEVLDPEQNKYFRDHFLELPFDLSDCVFIATANTLDTIPRPLLDRMEIIKLSGYTKFEKLSIAKNHLIPKQIERHGLSKRTLSIKQDALEDIISYYTREAGVRNLERCIADICRKAGARILDGEKSVKVTGANLSDFLGKRKIKPELISDTDEIGVVNGLAYTELGGDMLKVEVAVLEGSGKIELTGSLGDVMKESAHIALSYVRSIADEYSIPADFHKTKDIHIHFPEGAIPKDGPSAGVTMVTALVSALTGIAVKRDIAMTGEISLRGKVLAIGGLREKTMAAYTAGVRRVLIPEDNRDSLDEIDETVKAGIEFVFCERIDDVLREALVIGNEKGVCINRTSERRSEITAALPPHSAQRQIPAVLSKDNRGQ